MYISVASTDTCHGSIPVHEVVGDIVITVAKQTHIQSTECSWRLNLERQKAKVLYEADAECTVCQGNSNCIHASAGGFHRKSVENLGATDLL